MTTTFDPESEPINMAITAFPMHCIGQIDGLMKEIYDPIIKSAYRAQPTITLFAVICALSAFYGRRYELEGQGTMTNIFVVVTAPTGAGKEHPRSCNKKLFAKAGLGHILGADEFASDRAITSALEKEPVQLIQLDEFGKVMAGITGKNAAQYKQGTIRILLEQYSSSSGQYRGVQYADSGNLKPPVVIENPCLTLMGTTTSTTFYEALSSSSISDGLLNRIVVATAPETIPYSNPTRASYQPPDALVERLKYEYALNEPDEDHTVESESKGNLADLMKEEIPAASIKPNLIGVKMAPDVREALDQCDRYQTDIANSSLAGRELYGRMTENITKFAMIRAISANAEAPEITLKHYQWARELVEWSIQFLVVAVNDHIADTSHERHGNKIASKLKEAGRKGLSKSKLTRKTRGMSPKQRQEALQDLIESEEIQETTIETATKPGKHYMHKDFA